MPELYPFPVLQPAVTVTGADPTGTTDSSAAFIAAANSLGARRGTVWIPPGKYRVQNLPLKSGLYWVGAGQGAIDGSNGVYLGPIASPTLPCFVCVPDGSGDLYGSGISNMYVAGLQNKATATIDAIDASPITGQCHQLLMDNVWFDGWRRCYNGSANDRSIQATRCHFWNSTVGLYIPNNHPKLSVWNDFRTCTYGIQGTLVDASIKNQQFVACDQGVGPISTQINNAHFSNCEFFQCVNYGLQIGSLCDVDACQIVPPAANMPTGLIITGGSNTVNGTHFVNGAGGGTGFTNGAITFDCVTAAGAIVGDNITGCQFYTTNNAAILYHITSGSGHDIVNLNFSGNSLRDPGRIYTRSAAFGTVFYSSFNNNNLRLENTNIGASGDVFAVNNANTVGNTYLGNVIAAFAGATLRYAFGGDLTQSIIMGNYVRRTSGIDPAAAPSAIINNNIFQP